MSVIPVSHATYADGVRFSKGVLFLGGWDYSGDSPSPPALGSLKNAGLVLEVKINPTGFETVEAGGMPFDGPVVSQTKGGKFEISGTVGGVTWEVIASLMGVKLSDITDTGTGYYKLDPAMLGRYFTIQLAIPPHDVSNAEIQNSDTTPVVCDVLTFRKVKIDPSAFELAMKYELERVQLPFKAESMVFLEDASDPCYGLHGIIATGVNVDLTISSGGWAAS